VGEVVIIVIWHMSRRKIKSVLQLVQKKEKEEMEAGILGGRAVSGA